MRRARAVRLPISLPAALGLAAAAAGMLPVAQVPAEFFPVGVRDQAEAHSAEGRRTLEEIRRLGFNVVAAGGVPDAAAEVPLGVLDRLLGGAADAHIRRAGIATVPVSQGATGAAVTLEAWRHVARGARGILFDDWGRLQQNGGALAAATEFAEHITRNAALYAPLRPRVPAGGQPDVTLAGHGGTVTAAFLESGEALLLIVVNTHPAERRDVTMTFSPEMPEAVWQNMLTGSAVNFVAGPAGPVYARALAPEGVLVLMIRKRWR